MLRAAFSAGATHAALGGCKFAACYANRLDDTGCSFHTFFGTSLGKYQPETVVIVTVVGLVVVAVTQAAVVTVVEVATAPQGNPHLTYIPNHLASKPMAFYFLRSGKEWNQVILIVRFIELPIIKS